MEYYWKLRSKNAQNIKAQCVHYRVKTFQNIWRVLKTVTEHGNFIRARARLFKELYKDDWWSSILSNALFQIHILQLWLLVWIGRRVSNAVDARIWNYCTFSKYLSVQGRVLLNDDHKKTSISIDSQGWHESISVNHCSQSLRYCVKNKHKSLTEWLTGWRFVIFQ